VRIGRYPGRQRRDGALSWPRAGSTVAPVLRPRKLDDPQLGRPSGHRRHATPTDRGSFCAWAGRGGCRPATNGRRPRAARDGRPWPWGRDLRPRVLRVASSRAGGVDRGRSARTPPGAEPVRRRSSSPANVWEWVSRSHPRTADWARGGAAAPTSTNRLGRAAPARIPVRRPAGARPPTHRPFASSSTQGSRP